MHSLVRRKYVPACENVVKTIGKRVDLGLTVCNKICSCKCNGDQSVVIPPFRRQGVFAFRPLNLSTTR